MADFFSGKTFSDSIFDIALDEGKKTGDYSWLKRLLRLEENGFNESVDFSLAYNEFKEGNTVMAVDPSTGKSIYCFVPKVDKFIPDMTIAKDLDWYILKTNKVKSEIKKGD